MLQKLGKCRARAAFSVKSARSCGCQSICACGKYLSKTTSNRGGMMVALIEPGSV